MLRNIKILIVVVAIICMILFYGFYSITQIVMTGKWWFCTWYIFLLMTIFLLLYPLNIFVVGIFNIFGSTKFFYKNSKYYSCIKPNITNDYETVFVTIVIPVYNEDFDTVIKPTLLSLLACRNYYEETNISVNIFVNDWIVCD